MCRKTTWGKQRGKTPLPTLQVAGAEMTRGRVDWCAKISRAAPGGDHGGAHHIMRKNSRVGTRFSKFGAKYHHEIELK